MTVKALKKWLKDFNEDLEVVIGEYDMIECDDKTIFHDINGLEQLTSDDKVEFVSIHY